MVSKGLTLVFLRVGGFPHLSENLKTAAALGSEDVYSVDALGLFIFAT